MPEPHGQSQQGTARYGEYRRALAFVLPYWRKLAVVLAISLLSTLIGLIQPYIAKLLIDEALLRRNIRALIWVAALMVAVTIIGFIVSMAASYRYTAVSADVLFDMRLAVYRHLQRLSPRYFTRARLGDLVSRINNDVAEAQRVAADTALSLVSNAISLVGGVAIMLWLNWRLFFVSVFFLPVAAVALRHYQRRLTGQIKDLRERSAEIGSFLIETLVGVRLVLSSAAESHEVDRFRSANRRFIDALLKMQLTSYMTSAMPGTALALATASVFLYGGKLVIDGAMSLGALAAFMAYHFRLLGPIQGLMGLYATLATAQVSLGRIFELLDARPEVVERSDALSIDHAHGEIIFDRVSFCQTRENVVLDDVSFRIAPGSVSAIIGPSGAGKSTIADLMLRFLDPQSGSVRLDGQDLKDLKLMDLRRAVALVDQTPFLFHASIAENIAYARPGATREQIKAAAQTAAIDDFIESLPEGYDTLVGERGAALSAGERQRIAIARAILRNPSIIVLDEPSAALDPATEQRLTEALRRLFRNRTAILITHRMSLLEIADQVIVLEEGKASIQVNPLDERAPNRMIV